MFAFGLGDEGQLGTKAAAACEFAIIIFFFKVSQNSSSPVAVAVDIKAGVTFTQLACGAEHSAAITSDYIHLFPQQHHFFVDQGDAYVWGSSSMGQLGFGSLKPVCLRISDP